MTAAPGFLALLPSIGDGWTDAQWAEHDARIAAQRDADAAAASAAEFARMDWVGRGFPRRAVEAALVARTEEPALAAVARWSAQCPTDGLAVLSGSPGCGKTVAATWWGMRAGAVCVRASAFAASSRYDAETRDRWRNASALVLDDLGTEYADAKGNFLADLDDLIDAHYGNRSRLLITTNCTAADFRSRYGERIADRLRECGRWLSVAGGSLRKAVPR